MRRFIGGVITKNSIAPLTKNYYEPANGIYSINEAMQAVKASVWPTQGFAAASQVEYTTPGTYSWIAPPGTTSVSAVAVGAGGANGGGGGELRYRNNITVVPGTSYTVIVGNTATFQTTGTYGAASDGGYSQFVNSTTLKANGGRSAFNITANGGRGGVGDGGGNGANCSSSGNYHGYAIGGSGAGGYAGDGGPTGVAGSGGGGGGGVSIQTGSFSSYGRGGGVGLYGQGTSGAAGNPNPYPPYGTGPVGNIGNGGDGSLDVGGGAYANRAGMVLGFGQGYVGAGGGVRIVWSGTTGITRAFPSTNVLDL